MTILITGGTGTVGKAVVARLREQEDVAEIRIMTRNTQKPAPAGIVAVPGDLSDPDAVESALRGVRTLFLLVPNVADELTQALLALDAAQSAGIERIVYLSVFNSELFDDVPHYASKYLVERAIERRGLGATILRPNYFMQNDLRLAEALRGPGLYGMPVGTRGISMVDVRDIAEAAAIELMRRHRSDDRLPAERFDLVGPDVLNGDALAEIWGEVLGRTIRYGGDDLAGLEGRLRAVAPAWFARDMRLMMRRYQQDGASTSPDGVERLSRLLGRLPRSYRDFAIETARTWTPEKAI
ncbi:SDR family oxidoreductase [Rhizosaccharibacter radicis]|uniref:NmrA family NAD(P)-binding protein n=1 Tax=Rhizosaccharibacter radicis TaxID=2782605 RepID=A0ABT1W017_9PROT|nr:NmrA family NAD(P)-binding protein [Acetobacteraceae bacterium KSS12]